MVGQPNTTRASILQAALELFAEKGFHETSMASVAERAGVGKGTLYWHFSSKDEMFRTVLTERGDIFNSEVEKLMENVQQGEMKPDRALREFIRIKMVLIVENKDLSQIFLNNMHYTDREIKMKLLQMNKKMIGSVKEIITLGIEQGLFNPGPAREIAIALIGMTNSLGSVILHDDVTDPSQITDFAYKLVLHGICGNIEGGSSSD